MMKAGEIARQIQEALERTRTRMMKGWDVLSGPMETCSGMTPHDIVYEEDKLRVLHYKPVKEQVCPVPVLLIYALVNRYYMLDLQSDRSMVRNLLNMGLDLYLIDWGYASKADRYITLDDYINHYMDVVIDLIRKKHKIDKISLAGICQGGTFCAIYSALHPDKVKNLVTIVSPFDFSTNDGLLFAWSRNLDVDKMVDAMGTISGDFLNNGFLLLNPFRLMFDKYVDFLDHVDDPNFVSNFIRMEKWIFDSPAQAGEAFRQFIKDFYHKNLLIKNELEIGGKKVNLRDITMPYLNAYAEFDHLVPPASSRPIMDAVGSADKTMISFPTGHIGIFVGGKSQKEVCPKIGNWLLERSGMSVKKEEPKKEANSEDAAPAHTGKKKK